MTVLCCISAMFAIDKGAGLTYTVGDCFILKRNRRAMTDPIHWTQERKRLGDLSPWPRNPRQIKLPQAKRLLESVQEFGQVETLAVSPDGDIYNGHQRLNVLMEQYGPDYEVDVRVSSRPLSEKEREKLTVYLHKGAAGEWDFDTLANEFEIPELIEWGFEAGELGFGPAFEPVGMDEQPRLDEKKRVTCPECGHEFAPA